MNKIKVGDQLPQFSSILDDGKSINTKDIIGKPTILFFYPKDDTPGCTKEACSLRDGYDELKSHGFQLFGISPDTPQKHLKFKAKYSLPFPLIADTDLTVLQAFGIWGEKKFMGKIYDGVHRTTVISDAKGIVSHVIEKVITKDHAQQILELVGGR